MGRGELTDAAWAEIAPLLPANGERGGQWEDHRRIINGILWKLRTGAPWRDLPEEFGPWKTVATRFYRWCAAGVFDRALAALQQEADAAGELDWLRHFVDSTVVRAHQHAAGAKGGTQRRKRSAGAAVGSVPNSI